MRFIHIENPGSHSRLKVATGAIPSYSESQLLIQVKAAALNHADLLQRFGKYPYLCGESVIPGLEVAGVVTAVGAKVDDFITGDRIYGLVGGGAYAEFCTVEASLAHHMPDVWDYQHAASLPEALVTVYATLFELGALKPGQTVLIHGAGSGIASLAIQMAKAIQAKIITTVGSQNKIHKALALGADQVIQHKEYDFENLIEEQSVDLVVDFIGGDYFNKHLHLLKPQGKLVQIACLNGSTVECNLALIMRKRIQITGFVLKTQSLAEKSRLWSLAHQFWQRALMQNKIAPIIDSEFCLEQVEDALFYMQRGNHFGKIVLNIHSDPDLRSLTS